MKLTKCTILRFALNFSSIFLSIRSASASPGLRVPVSSKSAMLVLQKIAQASVRAVESAKRSFSTVVA